ncbi:MgtC/SapB family protein [Compostibacter hankyongensis]|uniref:MgtC/SapB family protein n=1 Tax=Compostibacter hankyongensis TaxID=1007089 RepID=A0ABP8G0E5_9BACT
MISTEQIVIRLCVAALLGSVVGLERQRRDWAAGLRTHMQVCLGSALVMIVSAFGFSDILGTPHVTLDPSRIAAQVVSGIGFLGAGTILFLRREVIRGLTTAAGLWTVAGVGLAVGAGLFLAAVVTTFLTLIILALIKPVEKRLFNQNRQRILKMILYRRQASLQSIRDILENNSLHVAQVVIQRGDKPEEDDVEFILTRDAALNNITRAAEQLREAEGVREIRYADDEA